MITLTRLYGPEEGTTGAVTYVLATPIDVVKDHHLYTVRCMSVYSINDVYIGLEDAQEIEPWSGEDFWTTLRTMAYGSSQEGQITDLGRELMDALWQCDELFSGYSARSMGTENL